MADTAHYPAICIFCGTIYLRWEVEQKCPICNKLNKDLQAVLLDSNTAYKICLSLNEATKNDS